MFSYLVLCHCQIFFFSIINYFNGQYSHKAMLSFLKVNISHHYGTLLYADKLINDVTVIMENIRMNMSVMCEMLQKNFDCRISPLVMTSKDLAWAVTMWTALPISKPLFVLCVCVCVKRTWLGL